MQQDSQLKLDMVINTPNAAEIITTLVQYLQSLDGTVALRLQDGEAKNTAQSPADPAVGAARYERIQGL
jgi:hypothetical protein